MDANEKRALHIPDEIEALMEERMIRREDVEKVIQHAEATGEKFVHTSTGRFLASFRPERVTYWVAYSAAEDGFQIHSVYSHRMEMKRGTGS